MSEVFYLIYKIRSDLVSYNGVVEEFIHMGKIYALFCSMVAFIFIDIDHVE